MSAFSCLALVLGLLLRAADIHGDAGHHLEIVGMPAVLLHPALHVGVERLGVLDRGLRGEHHVGDARGQLSRRLRRSGLDDDRIALRRPADAERALHREIFAGVIEDVDLGRIDIAARRLVARERVAVVAAPQAAHHIDELLAALVTVAMRGMDRLAEIGGVLIAAAGDQIPAGAAAGQMIERGERARDVVGLVVGGRRGRDEAEVAA